MSNLESRPHKAKGVKAGLGGRRGGSWTRTGEWSGAALCLLDLKVHPLCLSLDTHFICLSPWSDVPASQCPVWCWLPSSQHLDLGNRKSILKYHLNSWEHILLAWLHSFWQRCVCAHAQGGTCGLSMTIRTYPCEQLEGQVSEKWAIAGKNFQ